MPAAAEAGRRGRRTTIHATVSVSITAATAVLEPVSQSATPSSARTRSHRDARRSKKYMHAALTPNSAKYDPAAFGSAKAGETRDVNSVSTPLAIGAADRAAIRTTSASDVSASRP